ncbi:MAG: energy transducer TonB [Candidatus Acidiferrales bacterium]
MTRSGILVGLLVATGMMPLANAGKGDVAAKYPDPEDATVQNGVFQDDYFGMRYPLPSGWVEDLKGPGPSASGYYSLAALKPKGELVATMQISAQDNFFGSEPAKDATSFMNAMKKGLDVSLSAPNAVAHVKLGEMDFARLDYSGAGLSHIVLATEIRCYMLIFSITASREPAAEMLVASLWKLSFAQDRSVSSSNGGAAPRDWPVCIPESAYRDHIAHRVDPVMTGPRYASVPVRLIVGADGKLEHIHAISGFPEQVRSVTDALAKWEFKPYIVNGQPVEVETGLLFQFPSAPPQRNSGK